MRFAATPPQRMMCLGPCNANSAAAFDFLIEYERQRLDDAAAFSVTNIIQAGYSKAVMEHAEDGAEQRKHTIPHTPISHPRATRDARC